MLFWPEICRFASEPKLNFDITTLFWINLLIKSLYVESVRCADVKDLLPQHDFGQSECSTANYIAGMAVQKHCPCSWLAG